MYAVNIKWDTDGDKELRKNLPKEMEIPNEIAYDEDGKINYDGIENYLSDEVGFCHYGYELDY